jgi:hypothetical protein
MFYTNTFARFQDLMVLTMKIYVFWDGCHADCYWCFGVNALSPMSGQNGKLNNGSDIGGKGLGLQPDYMA